MWRPGGGTGPLFRPASTLAKAERTEYISGTMGAREGAVPLRARSSAGEHCVDIAGVAGSIPAAPTIQTPRETGGFSFAVRPRVKDWRSQGFHLVFADEVAGNRVDDLVFGDTRRQTHWSTRKPLCLAETVAKARRPEFYLNAYFEDISGRVAGWFRSTVPSHDQPFRRSTIGDCSPNEAPEVRRFAMRSSS